MNPDLARMLAIFWVSGKGRPCLWPVASCARAAIAQVHAFDDAAANRSATLDDPSQTSSLRVKFKQKLELMPHLRAEALARKAARTPLIDIGRSYREPLDHFDAGRKLRMAHNRIQ
jgi:hypothetical protein